MNGTKLPVSFDDISEAHQRIRNYIHKTPVITCSAIDQLVGRKVYFKCESLQKTGSFKARGALNTALKTQKNSPNSHGVAAYSSGNHGQGVAWAARMAGVPCTVVIPNNVSNVKINAIKGYGGDVVFCEPTPRDRVNVCRQVAEERQQTIIPTCDHYDVIAGQGTIAIEFCEQVPNLDAILGPMGGGGMLSGVAIAAKHINPSIKIYAVEPKGKDLQRSLRAGERLWPDPPRFIDTVCDGMRMQPAGMLTFPILCQLLEKDVFTISDDDVISAMKFAMQRIKLVVETTSAAAVAAVLSDQMKALDSSIQHVGVILSGGNVDLDRLPWH